MCSEKTEGQCQQRWPWGEGFSTSGLGGEDKRLTYRSHRLERMIVVPRVGTFLPWHSRALHCFPSFCLLGFSFFLVPHLTLRPPVTFLQWEGISRARPLCLCLCLSLCVYTLMCVEDVLLQVPVLSGYLWDRDFHWPGAHQVCWAGRPRNPKDLCVSMSLVLRSWVHTIMPDIKKERRWVLSHTQVPMLAKHCIHWVSSASTTPNP